MDAGGGEAFLDPVEEGGGGAFGEFDLDLAPGGGGSGEAAGGAVEAFGADGVGGGLGEEGAVGSVQGVAAAGGAQPQDGAEGRVPGAGAEQAGEVGGEGVGERGVEFVAGVAVGGDGEFEVPAGVVAAGAAAQGGAGGGEAAVVGVEVGGVEFFHAPAGDAGDALGAGQRVEEGAGGGGVRAAGLLGCGGGFVLPLGLAGDRGHGPTLTAIRAPGQSLCGYCSGARTALRRVSRRRGGVAA